MYRKGTLVIIAIIFAIIVLAFIAFTYFIINIDKFYGGIISKEYCEANGGLWKECGNKCQIINGQSNTGIVCPAVCEELCECNGPNNLKCPEEFICRTPKNIINATGYCD